MKTYTTYSLNRILVLWAACLALSSVSFTGHAAEMSWRSKPFQIVANEKPLSDFLRELAASQGTTAVINPNVEGTISGKFSVAGGALVILDSVCATYGLTWYYDGSFLFIDPVGEVTNEVLPISQGSALRVEQTVRRLNIADPRYPLVVNQEEGSIFVSGPRRYVELVRQAVQLAEDPNKQTDRAVIRFFPLKYARAADMQIVRNGERVTVFGVASILRSLFEPTSVRSSGLGSASAVQSGPSRQVRLSSGESAQVPKLDLGASVSGASTSFGSTGKLPQFQADTGLNGILVRDLGHRMNQYASLIKSLDVRPQLVEIEVTIMDISSDKVTSLGIDWRAHGDHADAQFGRGDGTPLTWAGATTEAGQTGAATPRGIVFTGSIGNSLREYFLARVTALAETGQANFVARPKVSTIDNVEASLENSNEFYVKVSGFQDAGLFNIKAGTSLRVTPMIIQENGTQGVMMTIHINDSSLGPVLSDGLPSIRNRAVNTQALVDEGKSLLIAGYSSEETSRVETGVPGLSSIPVLGNLFKYNEKKQVNMERFYLLTPRLIGSGAALAQATRAPELKPSDEALAAPAAENADQEAAEEVESEAEENLDTEQEETTP
ncbi:MAG TPA: type III secretion system outer membrane ring subunit SctC [Burkholderiaceae bacterium]|nr:type III secretion system outer membrane ring subunit SctC [Burkholderiaceae bacterium]